MLAGAVWLPDAKNMLIRLLLLIIPLALLLYYMFGMPGTSYVGPLPESSADESAARPNDLEGILQGHVRHLAETIGPRNVHTGFDKLIEAGEYLAAGFASYGYQVNKQPVPLPNDDRQVMNIEAERRGSGNPQKILVIGAHYDSVEPVCPAANDNASGVAAMLALAERLRDYKPECTLRFVGFVNEEPPFFLTPYMGSLVYASAAKDKGEQIIGMFSLETIGYYSESERSQRYPFGPMEWWYPSKGNFIGFVSNMTSGFFLRRALKAFREEAKIASEGIVAPEFVPGISWSDHWAFAVHGYSSVMVTDTAPYRYPHYHEASDTWEKLNYAAMARVVEGMEAVIKKLCP